MENKSILSASPRLSVIIYSILSIVVTVAVYAGFSLKLGVLTLFAFAALPFAFKYRFLTLNLFLVCYAFMPDTVILAAEFFFLAIFFIERFVEGKHSFKPNSLLIPLVLVMLTAAIGTVTSVTIIGSMRDLMMNLGGFSVMLMLYGYVDTKERLNQVLTSIVIGAFLVSVFGLFQYKFMGTIQREWIDASLKGVITKRAYSVFLNPNIFAEYLVLTTPIAVGLFWAHKDGFKKFVYLCIAGLELMNMLLTFSRGGFLSVTVAACVFLFFMLRPLLVLSIPFGLLGLNFLPDAIRDRIFSIFNFNDSSTNYRFKMWSVTKEVIRDHPINGVGFGHKAFKQTFEQYIRSMPIFHAHNTYLEVLAETGAVGFVVFAYTVIATLVNLIKTITKTDDAFIRTIAAALIASAAGILVNGFSEHIIYINRIITMLWVLIGLSGVTKNICFDRIN